MDFLKTLLEDFYTEDIESHSELNPKLFEDNLLKSDIIEKINEIVNVFLANLKEDGIKLDVDDIILVGSNVSYNYNKNSDLDIHIVADTSNLSCPDNLYPLLYGAYKSIFNKDLDIDFYGIPVEIYVETDDTPLRSNGIYSVKNNEWIKEPDMDEIPEINFDEVDEALAPFEQRYAQIRNNPNINDIDELIEDIYEERKQGMTRDNGEYSIENLVFKEFRNKGYLDELKELKNDVLSKELSLESLHESVGRLSNADIYNYKVTLVRLLHTQDVQVFNDKRFTIYNVKESDLNKYLRLLQNAKEVESAHPIESKKYDFNHFKFDQGRPEPSIYYIINGILSI